MDDFGVFVGPPPLPVGTAGETTFVALPTERTYRSVVGNQVVPALGELRLREVTTGVVSRALRAIADRHGHSAAKSSKACLSGMFRMAIEDGAVSVNPVRDSSTRISVVKKSPRALTPSETEPLTSWLRANERAVALDVPDLVDWMLPTGCRIGGALALCHGLNPDGRPLLDLDANTWEVNATVVRVPGQGLVVQPRPKTAAGRRVVAVPDFAAAIVRGRAAGAEGVIFTVPQAKTVRAPSNASADLRQLRGGAPRLRASLCSDEAPERALNASPDLLRAPAGGRLGRGHRPRSD